MSKRNLDYHPDMRPSLDESPKGPLIKAVLALLGIAALLALLAFILLPALKKKPSFPQPTASPSVVPKSPAPTATPGLPGVAVNPVKTLALPEALFRLLPLDTQIWNGKLLFVTGEDVKLPDTLVQYDLATGVTTTLETPGRTKMSVRSPAGNDRYLAYFETDGAGGGSIRYIEADSGTDRWLCDVAYGLPKLLLSGNVLLFQTRTDESAVKLFAVDLDTGESAVAAIWTDAPHASSGVSLRDGRVTYAEAGDGEISVVVSLDIPTGERRVFLPGRYAHDPAEAGEGCAFLSDPHGPEAELLYMQSAGSAPVSIARGVVCFGCTTSCVAYQSGEGVYAYVPATGETYPLAAAGAALMAAGDGIILWREESGGEAPLIRYMETE